LGAAQSIMGHSSRQLRGIMPSSTSCLKTALSCLSLPWYFIAPGIVEVCSDEVACRTSISFGTHINSWQVATSELILDYAFDCAANQLISEDTMKLLEYTPDHNDKIDENDLSDGFDVTAEAWLVSLQLL